MNLREIVKSNPEEIKRRIGVAPYLYLDRDTNELNAAASLGYILYVYGKRINEVNIDVYAYGYKKEGSELEYCDPGLVKKRFDKLTSEGHYEVIDEDGYADASYEVVEYLGEENKDAIVNGIPVKDFIKLEMEARIKKSDELRGPTF